MLTALTVAGCAAGVVAGLWSGPLWLDETLSVEIATLPLAEFYSALRQDGSPPLYYLLLHGWMALLGEGTVVVRLPSALLTAVALLLAYRVGTRLGELTDRAERPWDPVASGRACVIVLAALPWTMRFGSEARMYVLVVVLVLAGTLALLAVHRSASRGAVLGLAASVTGLLLTHYWALFVLMAVGLLHLPGLLRRRPPAVRVAVAGTIGVLAFLPWLPTFLFQAAHTGAPWAKPVQLLDLLRWPRFFGAGTLLERTIMAWALSGLGLLAVARVPVARHTGGVATGAVLLAWTSVAIGGGAYVPRYMAVVVPLVALTVALGALALPGPRRPFLALALVAGFGVATGIPAAGGQRTFAGDVASAFRSSAASGDLLVYCPDQLGPPVARLLGPGYRQVVYPSLQDPARIDWVDYRARQDAADPQVVAARVDALAGRQRLFVLVASGYRTFEGDCERLLSELAQRRGRADDWSGTLGGPDPLLFRFP